jgi:hypothetical protein
LKISRRKDGSKKEKETNRSMSKRRKREENVKK